MLHTHLLTYTALTLRTNWRNLEFFLWNGGALDRKVLPWHQLVHHTEKSVSIIKTTDAAHISQRKISIISERGPLCKVAYFCPILSKIQMFCQIVVEIPNVVFTKIHLVGVELLECLREMSSNISLKTLWKQLQVSLKNVQWEGMN